MRIVFMGTPRYSLPTVSALFESGHDVAAVFCQPDKPVGRKQILTPPAVKVFANEHGIPVFQPATLRDGEALKIIKEINPDIIVVVAYGKILPKEILDMPKYGCINGHASLLPKLRGASPIQWAIVTGEKKTGVTVMQMDEGMDTGDILMTSEVDIMPDDTADTLFDRLSGVTARLILKAVASIENGDTVRTKQNGALATYAPIINKEMAHIDFSKSADDICNAVRGFNSWPGAFCFIDGRRVKVLSAAKHSGGGEAGRIIGNEGKLVVSCGHGEAVEFLTVQPEGSKPMSAAQMLNGRKIALGTVVS
ncbi:MAG: methionyl-tRNA formyltransferase [Clostridia bacterium]|nr:methionyl-tRNA formyltransferase [Clostridia bacterium]